MKPRLFTLTLGLLLVPFILAGCGSDDQPEGPLLQMLRYVPDTPVHREYLTFGDAEAWHASWDVPRIDSVDELDRLDRHSRAYWLFIMSSQTTPPDTLGYQFLFTEDQRGFYGFDLFNLDRYLLAGRPPDTLTVVEFSFDKSQVADALTASGYQATELETDGTLYSVGEDYELDFESPTQAGRLGNLNRILLFDGRMLIAKATANVTRALQAQDDEVQSLAQDPRYVAAAGALQDDALKETGELVGVILMEGSQFYALDAYLTGFSAEQIEALKERFADQGPQLPAYDLVAFATRHTEGASYLILAVVFDEGTDAGAAADLLADRLKNYESVTTRQPLDEYWTFDRATGVEANGLPVALVVMRVDDPPPTPEDASRVNTAVFSWVRMITQRDMLFLAIE